MVIFGQKKLFFTHTAIKIQGYATDSTSLAILAI